MADEPSAILLGVVLQDAALFLLTVALFWAGVFVARRFGRRASYGLRALGFARPKSGLFLGAGLGFLVGLGALAMNAIVAALSALVLESFDYPAENTTQEPLLRGLRDWVGSDPTLAISVAVFVVVLFVPAVEELVFRGALFGGLRQLLLGLLISRGRKAEATSRTAKRLSFVLAALLSSAVFALLHLSLVVIPAFFILAIVLCILYERTGSLLPPIVAHATFNSFATLLIILIGLGVLEMPV